MSGLRLPRGALVTIDTQADTLDGRPLEVPGSAAVVPNIVRLCQAFREACRPIIHVVRLYRADGSNAEPIRRELVRGATPVLRPGTPGRLLAPGLLDPGAGSSTTTCCSQAACSASATARSPSTNPRWGAFFGTSLEAHLRDLQVDSLVSAGCSFPNCPRTSVYEASERDFRIALVDDAVSGLYDRGGTRCGPSG